MNVSIGRLRGDGSYEPDHPDGSAADVSILRQLRRARCAPGGGTPAQLLVLDQPLELLEAPAQVP